MKTQVDYSKMRKGDVLSTEHVEEATGVDRGDAKRFPFALLAIADQVRRGLASAGKFYTVATSKQQVVVLTDPEASPAGRAEAIILEHGLQFLPCLRHPC